MFCKTPQLYTIVPAILVDLPSRCPKKLGKYWIWWFSQHVHAACPQKCWDFLSHRGTPKSSSISRLGFCPNFLPSSYWGIPHGYGNLHFILNHYGTILDHQLNPLKGLIYIGGIFLLTMEPPRRNAGKKFPRAQALVYKCCGMEELLKALRRGEKRSARFDVRVQSWRLRQWSIGW